MAVRPVEENLCLNGRVETRVEELGGDVLHRLAVRLEVGRPRAAAVGQVDPLHERRDHLAKLGEDILASLLDEGFTPVIATVAPDVHGRPMNVNADEAAGAIAGAINAEKLVYLTNVDGLYRDLGDAGSLISELKAEELRAIASPSWSRHGCVPRRSSPSHRCSARR